jgi:hypothetical protein
MVVRLTYARAVKSRPFLICTAASPGAQWRKPVSDSSSGAPERDRHCSCCTITKGYRELFLTGDTNDPDSIETAQIGWFQVLKGYVPEEWTLRQESFFAADVSTKYSTGEQWTKELIEFFWTHGNTL